MKADCLQLQNTMYKMTYQQLQTANIQIMVS